MSLTPAGRKAEATQEAMYEGYVNGLLTLLPSSTAVYIATQRSAAFAKRTNFQSRTALAIMPALFMFAVTAELRLTSKMHEIAEESQHSSRTVQWAEQQAAAKSQSRQNQSPSAHEAHLMELYKQSVETGVRIVPGDTLGVHHRMANYLAANPIKVLAGVAVPAVGYIFYGRSGKEHLDLSVKIMHTRVFGQFATISLLLSVMGFKEFMDRNGKFITQAEADERVEEMKRVRLELMDRLDAERQRELEFKAELAAAHEQDVQDAGSTSHHSQTSSHGKKKKRHAASTQKDAVDNPIHNV